MPTTRKRHSVTETDPVQRALEPLRSAGVPIDLADLVRRGAESLADELAGRRADDEHRARLRQRFVDRTARGDGIDVDAALEARGRAWSR